MYRVFILSQFKYMGRWVRVGPNTLCDEDRQRGQQDVQLVLLRTGWYSVGVGVGFEGDRPTVVSSCRLHLL